MQTSPKSIPAIKQCGYGTRIQGQLRNTYEMHLVQSWAPVRLVFIFQKMLLNRKRSLSMIHHSAGIGFLAPGCHKAFCFGPLQCEVKMKKSNSVLTFLEFLFSGLTVHKYHNMAHNSIQEETLQREQNPTEIVQEIDIPLNIASQTAYSAFCHSALFTRYPLHLLHTLPILLSFRCQLALLPYEAFKLLQPQSSLYLFNKFILLPSSLNHLSISHTHTHTHTECVLSQVFVLYFNPETKRSSYLYLYFLNVLPFTCFVSDLSCSNLPFQHIIYNVIKVVLIKCKSDSVTLFWITHSSDCLCSHNVGLNFFTYFTKLYKIWPMVILNLASPFAISPNRIHF